MFKFRLPDFCVVLYFKTWIIIFGLTKTLDKYFVSDRPKRSFYVFAELIINVIVDVDNSANYLYSMMIKCRHVF